MIIHKEYLKTDLTINDVQNHNKLIFDIETTGLSPKHSMIYMIGMIYYDTTAKQLVLEQWFAAQDSDEYEMLHRFNEKIRNHEALYHYNGDQFDIPFIKKRMALYRLTLNEIKSIDFLKVIRPFKKMLSLDNLKLKTVEAHFGYEREDPFSGGDLIEVYKAYRQTQDERLLTTLLRHNYEDLLGLKLVLEQEPLFNILKQMKDGSLSINLEASFIENGFYKAVFPINTKHHLTFNHELFEYTIKEGKLNLSIPTTVEVMKLFFEPPSDYYYLPAEDYAIHKSIGQFVHKDHRVKATKDNCYVKKEDFFLPAYKHFELPINLYYKDPKDKVGYIAVSDLVETNLFASYLSQLLTLSK